MLSFLQPIVIKSHYVVGMGWTYKTSLILPYCIAIPPVFSGVRITRSLDHFTKRGVIKLVLLCQFVLKSLYQAKEVSDHVFVCCASFYDFDILFWNCFDSVVFLVFHFIMSY